jgi:integrator complex subunit 7
MLPAYPSEDFTLVTLHTLTQLAAHTLVDIPEQVELLIKYLHDDPRFSVKKMALSNLRYLASADRAHLWSQANVSAVTAFALNDAKDSVLCGALTVLCDIVQHTSIDKFRLVDSSSPVMKLCENCCYSSSLVVAAKATQLLTSLATQCVRETHHVEGTDISGEAVMAIEALFLLMNSGTSSRMKPGNLSGTLKECLQCVVRLCNVQPEACDQFVDIIGGMLLQTGNKSS